MTDAKKDQGQSKTDSKTPTAAPAGPMGTPVGGAAGNANAVGSQPTPSPGSQSSAPDSPEQKQADKAAEQVQEQQKKSAANMSEKDDEYVKSSQQDGKSKSEQQSAATGAKAVADAVSKVADAAVAEVQKQHPGPSGAVQVSGTAGGTFTITGDGFGPGGTVTFNGVQVPTRAWSTTLIIGHLPAHVQEGEVVITVDEDTKRRGFFKR